MTSMELTGDAQHSCCLILVELWGSTTPLLHIRTMEGLWNDTGDLPLLRSS